MTLAEALAQKIREHLKAERLSQRDFAKRLGVSQGTVSYLLSQKRRAAVLDYYERLAGMFGVPLSTLIADLEHRTGRRGPVPPAAVRAVLQSLIDLIDAGHAG